MTAFYLYQLKLLLRNKRLHLIIISIFTLSVFVYFALAYYLLCRYFWSVQQLPPWASNELIEEYENNTQSGRGSLLSPQSPCVLSLMEPFNPEILHLFNKPMEPIDCADNPDFPLIFESSVEPYPKLIPVMSKSQINDSGISECCFRRIFGMTHSNLDAVFGQACKSISLENKTRIPDNWEFVTVECDYPALNMIKRVVDIHAFPYSTKPDNITNDEKGNGSRPLNVLIIGMDAMSRLNFRRTMPEIHDFLVKNLSALEFMGYHKIGESTFPNIGPLLTNGKIVEYDKSKNDYKLDCENSSYIDNCPFIWKRFKLSGYTTLFAEDTFGMNIFNMNQRGFLSPPVDHYFLPYQAVSPKISHNYNGISPVCFGPRYAFQVLMNYAENMAISAGNTPFFQFVHSGSITHEFINGPRLIVEQLLKTIQFYQQRSLLNNTVLILLSDHGSRIDEIRAHPQGYLEDKLPFLYFVVPEWFPKVYPKAYSNLQDNTRWLITVRDIYKTMEDIVPKKNGLDLDNLETGVGNMSASPGISLFQQIPLSRTCETAHIPEQFCICNKTTSSAAVAIRHPSVVQGAEATVEYINGLLIEGGKNEGMVCAELRLSEILRAERLKSLQKNVWKKMYRVVLRTIPGNAIFEAEVSKRKFLLGKMKVDRVTRINTYKKQSQCISNSNLKPFCFCKT